MQQHHNEIPFDYPEVPEAQRGHVELKPVKVPEIKKIIEQKPNPLPAVKRKRFSWEQGQEQAHDVADEDSSGNEESGDPGAKKPKSDAPSAAVAAAAPAKPAPRQRIVAHTVVVSGLSGSADEAALRAAFGGCGEILEAAVWRKGSGTSKGKGFVEFADTVGVQNALQRDGSLVDEHTIHIELKRHEAPTAKPVPSEDAAEATPRVTVFVQGLYPTTPENVLRDFFQRAGPVVECRLMAKKRCALVKFDSLDSSRKALALNGQKLMGQALKVQYDRNPDSLKRIIPEDVRQRQREATRLQREREGKGAVEETPDKGNTDENVPATATVEEEPPSCSMEETATLSVGAEAEAEVADGPESPAPPPPARGTWWKPQKVLAKPKAAPKPAVPLTPVAAPVTSETLSAESSNTDAAS